jgi:phosphatidate cytidylyltransferase
MHLKRLLTAIIAVPVLIYIIGVGPRWLFHILLLLVAAQGLTEFYRFTSHELPSFVRWSVLILTFGLFSSISWGHLYVIPVMAFLWAVIPMAYFMFTYRSSDSHPTEVIGKAVLGPLYVVLPLSMLMIIDGFPKGHLWVFFILSVVFAGDTAAFYFGRILGKHKLHPKVSPGKTWEGAAGGLVASLFVAFLWGQFSTLYLLDLHIVALTILLSAASQIGDLTESMLKRNHNVKDSGGILPWHGGILDRIDGVLFSVPVLYLFLAWSGP